MTRISMLVIGMDCYEKMMVSGAIFMILFWLILLSQLFNAVITIIILTILLLASWIMPGLFSDNTEDCYLIAWVIGGLIGLVIMMPLLFYMSWGGSG